jgi:YVTN family beta-propeller protein
MLVRNIFAAVLLSTMAVVPAFAGASVEYKLTKSVALGAPERWDYVVYDPSSHRVFVAHSDHVSVVDGRDGTVLGEIGPFPGGTHGTAIATAAGRGYTDDGKAGVAASFDLKTLKVIKRIPAEPDADGMVFDPVSGHVFVTDGDSGHITVIDPATDTAIATIDGGGGLEYSAVDGHGKLFVNGEEKGEIVAIDTATNKVIAHYPMAGCQKPHGMAVDSQNERVFSSCANGVLVVVDGNTGANLASLPIGKYTDAAAFDPMRKLAFSSNGDGTVTIIRESDPQNFAVAGTIQTVPGARTMSIDPETGRLFLVGADIAKIDLPTAPGGRPHVTYVPGSVRLMFFDPQ